MNRNLDILQFPPPQDKGPDKKTLEQYSAKIEKLTKDKENLKTSLDSDIDILNPDEIAEKFLNVVNTEEEKTELTQEKNNLERELAKSKKPSRKEKLEEWLKEKRQEMKGTMDELLKENEPKEIINKFLKENNLAGKMPSEFENLATDEQKLFVVQNLKKKIVDIVLSDSKTQYSDYLKKKMVKGAEPDGLVAKIASDVSNAKKIIGEGFKKEFEVRNIKNKLFKELLTTTEGQNLLAENTKLLSNDIKNREVCVGKDNAIIIRYIGTEEMKDWTPKEKQTALQFNEAANKFREIPYEWGQESKSILNRSRLNRIEYEKAKTKYEKARGEILNVQANKIGGKEALLENDGMNRSIEMQQHLNTHPEFEKELDKIQEGTSTNKALMNTGGNFLKTIAGKDWKILLLAGGFVGRMFANKAILASNITGGTLAVTALVGGVVGRLRGYFRAKDTLKTSKKEGRHRKVGTKEEETKRMAESENKINFVNATDLSKRITALTGKLENLQNNPNAVQKYVKAGDTLEVDGKKMRVMTVSADGKVSMAEIKSQEWKTTMAPGYPENETYEMQKKWLVKNVPKFAGKTTRDIPHKEVDDFEKKRAETKIMTSKLKQSKEKNKEEMAKILETSVLDQIKRRIEYTKGKIADGLVNFGDKRLDLVNISKLSENLTNAAVVSVMMEKTVRKDIDAKLKSFFFKKEERIEKAQDEFIHKQAVQGMYTGVRFAVGGYVLKWIFEGMPGLFGKGHHAENIIQEKPETEVRAPVVLHHNEIPKTDTVHVKEDLVIRTHVEEVPEAETEPVVEKEPVDEIDVDETPEVKTDLEVEKEPVDEIDVDETPKMPEKMITIDGYGAGEKPGIIDEEKFIKIDGYGAGEVPNPEEADIPDESESPESETPVETESVDPADNQKTVDDTYEDTTAPEETKIETEHENPKIDQETKTVDDTYEDHAGREETKIINDEHEESLKNQATKTVDDTYEESGKNPVPTESINNPYQLSEAVLKEVNQTFQVNTDHIFRDQMDIWENMKNEPATKIWALREEGNLDPDILDETDKTFFNYLDKLKKVTGLTPRAETLTTSGETTEEYIKRALQRAAKIGELAQFKR